MFHWLRMYKSNPLNLDPFIFIKGYPKLEFVNKVFNEGLAEISWDGNFLIINIYNIN